MSKTEMLYPILKCVTREYGLPNAPSNWSLVCVSALMNGVLPHKRMKI